jgi:Tol biopolymer transport system component
MAMQKSRMARWLAALTGMLMSLGVPMNPAHAQYFGRNKVNFDHFDFRILPTQHYNLYFYPSESLATADAARMAERWYTRHNALLKQTFDKNPLIIYADPPDFQQSNVIEGFIGQGTGGVTEGARDRVIMPLTGAYAESDHVLGHELVHVFQYHMAQAMPGGLANVERIPLWLIEGMAEYLSLGRNDPNTAMWLRDAVRRKDMPTIKQLTNDPRYFPYRYGQALWAYIGGEWGDDAVYRVYRAALVQGWEPALKSVLGLNADGLSAAWHASIRQQYGPIIADRTPADQVGKPVVIASHEGDQNVSPTVSPDGKYVAFFSSRSLFGMDLYIAEVATGKVIKQVTSVTRDAHFDALSFISSAGSWSPDARKLAVVVYANGDNEINIVDVDSRNIEQRIKPAGIGAMADPAWSPDGRSIAFSGMKGGISDLYIHDLTTHTTQQLTNDREAQLQPAWSPDGKTIVFVTDAGPETNFEQLSHGPMRLALMDMSTRQVRLLSRFGNGKHINPQFSPDGASLYFVSDQDGVSDIYRTTLNSGETARLTHIATGVSGITSLSPTLSVARKTGDMLFSVFDKQGFAIRALPPQESAGTQATAIGGIGRAGLLPPDTAYLKSIVAQSLNDAVTGLPAPYRVGSQGYSSGLSLDYVGGPQIGVAFGGGFGTGLAGGVALGFSDMLGNQLVNTVIQAQGDVKDIGGQALYLNRSRRWTWGLETYHIPLAGVFAGYSAIPINVNGQTVQGTAYTQILQRVFYDNAQVIAQYPFSTTRRLEFSAGFQRVSFNTQVDSLIAVGNTVVAQTRNTIPSEPGLNFAAGSAAFVGDYSFSGFTSPVAGGRYRFEVSPYVGSLNYETLLADYRHYFFMRPFTLAVRGIHFGRYGSSAEDPRLGPMFVGQPYLIRGYDPNSFDVSECSAQPGANDNCPQFTRLSGSRLGVANMEFRIPLFGTEQFGLLNFPFLPTEIAPFVDAGVAWNQNQSASFRFDQNTPDRVPVFSTGISARFNLFGYAVGEVYWVHPYQRPGKQSMFGFQLVPGW